MSDLSPTQLAVNQAIRACTDHWSTCCKSAAKHWLDEKDLCETGKKLYQEFERAERADRMAQYGDPRPLWDAVEGKS
jgi:hypothetical protein